jgi:hypothetical protein
VDKGAGGGVQGRSPAGDPSPDLYETLKNFLKTLFLKSIRTLKLKKQNI